jgi:thiol:disulfide interchange protein DsbD
MNHLLSHKPGLTSTSKLSKVSAFKALFLLVFLPLLNLYPVTSLNAIDFGDEALPDWQEESFLPVEQAFPYVKSLERSEKGEQVWTITWNVTEGYYLYEESIRLVAATKDENRSESRGEDRNERIVSPVFNKESEIKYDPNFDKELGTFKGQVIAKFFVNKELEALYLKFQGCAEAGLCYPMQEQPLTAKASKITESVGNKSVASKQEKSNNTPLSAPYTQLKQAGWTDQSLTTLLNNASLVKIIFIFFILGVGLCLTPCVLPMMPIISGLVLGREKKLPAWQAFYISSIYVLAMSLTYTLAGVMAASLGASANISIWMQNPWVLSAFAFLFVLLSLSMFDVYELRIPTSLQQKIDGLSRKQQGGSIFGALIMGVLSALVVSPCISAPLAGALVFISSTGDTTLGALALFSLGLGMGVPLIALCTFGNSLLPKTGAWLNYSKRFFGLLLIAVAIWMLARFINPQLILLSWGALFVFSSFCFGNWQSSPPILKAIQSVLLLWGIIMILGAALGNDDPLRPLENMQRANQATHLDKQQHVSFIRIESLKELEQQLTINKNTGRYLLLDFYADWCTSCDEIERDIFENPEFYSFLNGLTLIRADLSANSIENFELLEHLKLFGPPAILFFDKEGKELSNYRIQGTITAENFSKVVEHFEKQ